MKLKKKSNECIKSNFITCIEDVIFLRKQLNQIQYLKNYSKKSNSLN